MQIDWFTWIAQIINFLILVALLRYFLYGRIVKVIDERQKKLLPNGNGRMRKKRRPNPIIKSHSN